MNRIQTLLSSVARLAVASSLVCATVQADVVIVNQVNFTFSPADITISAGDTVRWIRNSGGHDVTEGTDGTVDGDEAFFGPLNGANPVFEMTFDAAFLAANPRPGGLYDYFCSPHFTFGMIGTITVTEGPGTSFCAETVYNCPCALTSAAGEGCPNSTGSGATLVGAGVPSIGASSFSLTATQIPNTSGLFVQGTNAIGGANGNPVGEGRLCLGPQKRYNPQSASGNAVTRSNFQNFASAGQSMNYQYWYRDPSNTCNGGGFNFSPAWNVTWLP